MKQDEYPVIFLDIDGVLNSATWFKKASGRDMVANGRKFEHHLDRECVERLGRLVDSTGAKLVLSSSWRYHLAPQKCQKVLRSMGATNARVIDRTPTWAELFDLVGWHGRDGERGTEIECWLRKHPEVERFVILDDNADMGDLALHLVQTNFKYGLRSVDARKAAALLRDEGMRRGPVVPRVFRAAWNAVEEGA